MAAFDIRPDFEQIPSVKVSYNVGALFDIPTGFYVFGKYGESILNGGVGAFTGVVGIANNFKSTIMHFLALTAMSHFVESILNTYDTEINIQEHVLRNIARRVLGFLGVDIFDAGRWVITDKTLLWGNEWFETFKSFLKLKKDNINKYLRETPFLDRDKKTLMKIAVPTFSEIDSLSKFQTQDVAAILDKNELGDSGANTVHMRQGLSKMLLVTELPRLIGSCNNPVLMTAHLGKGIPMDPRAPPVKKLQYLKNDDKIMGVSNDFTFLTTSCWNCKDAAPLLNKETKGPEYQTNPDDNEEYDTDLNIVTLVCLRNKNGPSGITIQLVVSQRDGVLPTLTEFHYIRTNEYYGLEGSKINYSLALYPEAKLSRNTVRGKIESDPKLVRAMNITSEMCQMYYLSFTQAKGLLCTPKELYDDLKAKGYDWDVLLATRGWWTFDNDKQPVPFLSTLDLLKMRAGTYIPYWFTDEQKAKITNKI